MTKWSRGCSILFWGALPPKKNGAVVAPFLFEGKGKNGALVALFFWGCGCPGRVDTSNIEFAVL